MKGVFMSAIAIDISDTNITLKDLLARLTGNQEIIITSSNQPVAKVTAVSEPAVAELSAAPDRRQAGLTKGAAWMSPDFNEPLEDFAEYMP
jgi:antitoxin (DNA-binding transcriptional repressor) of toxin-antitoxin stability system